MSEEQDTLEPRPTCRRCGVPLVVSDLFASCPHCSTLLTLSLRPRTGSPAPRRRVYP
jgi:uncharacterized Zn finger protein (UPF0148 family)